MKLLKLSPELKSAVFICEMSAPCLSKKRKDSSVVPAILQLQWCAATSSRKSMLLTELPSVNFCKDGIGFLHFSTSMQHDSVALFSSEMTSTCGSAFSASPTTSNDQEKELCVFFKRIGACRHGAKCSRAHVLPTESKTVVLKNLYRYVQPHSTQITCNSKESMAIFEKFYEEVFTEIDYAYGAITQMHVCENMGEHLIGNVYVKFLSSSTADRVVASLNNRYFARLPIYAELSSVENFHDAVCRQHEAGECTRGGFCNFLHVKKVSLELENRLFNRCYRKRRQKSYTSRSESDYDTPNISNSSSSSATSDAETTCSSDCKSNATYIESSEDEPDITVPKAFRLKPLSEDFKSKSDNNDSESETNQQQQISRRIRWQVFQKTLLDKSPIPWDDDAEQQYVFSLIG